ncbi:MAG TPA: hypothetical protein VMZ28_23310 [Kofleriaceae bacterium]|nr:hypothetical protein [Kofleriaceae bacterium]
MPDDPKGHRGRLSRSGLRLPLVKPATIAPPAPGAELEDEDDDYAEVSIERGVIEEAEEPPAGEDADADPDDDAVTPPR